jgi:ArsR family transcriptional regulator
MDLEVLESCASMLKALAGETRLSVVRQLLEGPLHVHELNEAVGAEPSLLSHHLKILRDAGIIEGTRDGKAVLYRLSPAVESRRRGKVIDLGCCRLSFD